MSFSKIFHILFIVGSTFFYSSFQSASIIHGRVSRRHSRIWKPKKSFLQIIPILLKMRGSNLLPSSHNYFRLREFFSYSRSISWVLSILFQRRPSFRVYSFSAFSPRSPNLTGASLKWSLISSWSLRSLVFKSPQVSSFIFQFFPVNCALLCSFSILTVVRSRFLFIRHRINSFIHSLFRNPTSGSINTFSSLRYISLNLFYENK